MAARARVQQSASRPDELALAFPAKITAGSTRFIKTTWLLSATRRLRLDGPMVCVRNINGSECDWMLEQARKRNVFARHSWENSFYLKRISELREATVVEILGSGEIDEFSPKARMKAALVEKIVFISSTLGLRRKRLHQLLAISGHRRYGFDLTIAPGFRYLRSSARFEPKLRGVPVDDIFIRRFTRCGFEQLLERVESGDDLANRISQATNWLSESLQDPATNAALVKTAIGLESLLIVNDVESLRGPLADRTAFLLANDHGTRKRVAKVLKRFYDARSAVVHGGKKASGLVSVSLLEGADRILILAMLSLGANGRTWSTAAELADWVNDQKWGAPFKKIKRPFPQSHLTRALQLMEAGS